MSWSLSSVKTHERCALQYKLRYIDRLPEKRGDAANRGIEKHAAVEDFITGKSEKLPTDLSFYTQFLTGLRQYENYPEHTITLDKEWKECPQEGRWFKGILDLLVLPGGDVANIYDWKTGKIYPDHDEQKSLYSLAVFAKYPAVQRVRAMHVYLDLGKNREVQYDRNQMHFLREHWGLRAQAVESASEFIPNPGIHCRWCPFNREKGGPCRF